MSPDFFVSDLVGLVLIFQESARRHDGVLLRPGFRDAKVEAHQLPHQPLFRMALRGWHQAGRRRAHPAVTGDGEDGALADVVRWEGEKG